MADVIAAVSTGSQISAIGIIRLSGEGCALVADRVFRRTNGGSVSQCAPRKLTLGTLQDAQGRTIDQCMAVFTPGPNSYTGEDTVEFHCHGSPAVLAAGLDALYRNGARPAGRGEFTKRAFLNGRMDLTSAEEFHCHGSPAVLAAGLDALYRNGARPAGRGEFTKRAFLNGRMDLTSAEAVIDLIEAETADAAANAAGQVTGRLQKKLEPIYNDLTDLCSHFHAVLDYPDEDIDDFRLHSYTDTLRANAKSLYDLLNTYGQGQILKRGVRAAIVGKPNVGKSSLLNALAGYERVIVTEVAGTTRDTVEESVRLGNTVLRLIDTAGIRSTEDRIEAMGVQRSMDALSDADLVILVLDSSALGNTVLRLIDTAGIRSTEDRIEAMGVQRSMDALSDADLVILVLDSSAPLTEEDQSVIRLCCDLEQDRIEAMGVQRSMDALSDADLVILVLDSSAPLTEEDQSVIRLCCDLEHVVVLLNKSDLKPVIRPVDLPFMDIIPFSAKTGEGMEMLADWVELKFAGSAPCDGSILTNARQYDAIRRAYESMLSAIQALMMEMLADWVELKFAGSAPCDGSILTNARQYDAIRRAYESMLSAIQALMMGFTPDAVLTDVELAMESMGEVTGATVREDITARIFERFCVGK